MDRDAFFSALDRYFGARLAEHGPTARGVDWSSAESQRLRFEVLLRVVDGDEPFSINDYGCGYGALASHLRESGRPFEYRGLDRFPPALEEARRLHAGVEGVEFVDHPDGLEQADYTVASGLFNLRLQVEDEPWREYVLELVDSMAAVSRRGFAFNMLTSYSEPEKMRPDLYYGDPCFFFDHCKRNHSRSVALLHDYGLWEFTILVRL